MNQNKLKNPKAILFTIPNFDTAGSGKALLNIATRLDRNYFNPQICCSHNKGKFFENVTHSGIKVHLKESTVDMKQRVKGMIQCFRLANYFRSLKIDLIHSFHYGPDYSEALGALLAGIPWVYTKKNMNWGGKSKNGWKLRSLLSKHVIVQNSDMIKQFFYNKSNVSLVPRGIDLEEFKPRKKNQALLDQYNINKNDLVIMTVANLVPVKGIEMLIDVFDQISKKYKNLRLLIVGDNNNQYGKRLEQKIKKLNTYSKIHFTGKIINVPDYYSIADLFIINTLDEGRREGCPVALLEAMACGLPVIGSDIPGIRDILKPFSKNLFQAGDIEELKKAIMNNLNYENKKLREDFKSRISKYYDISIEVSNHESIYKQCLNL